MAAGKTPLGHVVDLVVYAPVGLITLAQRELPELISAGKTRVDNQITLARFIGKMAVKQGSNEFKRRMRAAEASREAKPPAAQVIDIKPSIEVASPSPSPRSAPGAHLPIDGYDSLAASQVVQRLNTLTSAELEIVRVHEEANRARRTILGKIAQLQAR